MNYHFIHGFISSQMAQVICRTLLHSVWQGLVAAVVSGIIILATRKTTAATRYNLLSVTFTCFILGTLVTFFCQFNTTSPAVDRIVHIVNESKMVAGTVDSYWLPVLHKDKFYQPVIYYADKYATFITGVWLCFFFLQMARMSTGLHHANRLTRRQVVTPSYEWQQQLERLKKSLGIRRIVSLMESGLVKVPVVIGVLKPVVLVPLGMLTRLTPQQVETVLLHELAHVRRRDFAMNILQRVAECFFFFNPFIMWLSARIREEREACCDDIVMQHINDKRTYVEALISFRQPEDFRSYGHALTLARKNNLLYRVKRMITQENKKLNAMEKLTLIFVLVAATAISFMPAQKQKENRKVTSSRQSPPQQPVQAQTVKKNYPKETVHLQQHTDTLPQKQRITFKNISSTINDDGTTRTASVTAKGSDGKTYAYRLENNDIKDLSIDGVNVKQDDFDRYKAVIDEIEQEREEALQTSLLKQKLDIAQLHERQELLNKKLSDLQDDGFAELKMKQDLLLNNQKLTELNNLKLMQDKLVLQQEDHLALLKPKDDNAEILFKKMAAQDFQLQKLKEQHNALELLDAEKQLNADKMAIGRLEMKNKVLAAQDEQFHESNYQLAAILAELAEAGVIADKNNLSFTLNNEELIVDGKKQSAKLHETLRARYIKHKNDYYKYKAKPNSRSTDVYVE